MKYTNIATGGAPTGTDLRYPNVAFTGDMDYVKFTFHDYVSPFSSQGGGGAGSDQATYNKSSDASLGDATSTVYLYMPEDIEGQYGANWDNQNFNEVSKSVLATFGESAAGQGGAALGELFKGFETTSESFFTKGTGVANAVSGILAAANFGSLSVNDVFSATTQQILNPNTEVLYKGPKMRTFSLNFKMAPRNSIEAQKIKTILQCFKYATLPSFGGAGDEKVSFVKVPQIVDVTFMTGGSTNRWVTQFKPSVITDLSISYTPDGAWATLPDGSPVAVSLKVSFNETKMVYANEVVGEAASY